MSCCISESFIKEANQQAAWLVGKLDFKEQDKNDLAHEVFLKTLTGVTRYNPSKASQITFASRVAHNTAVNILRSRYVELRQRAILKSMVLSEQFLSCSSPKKNMWLSNDLKYLFSTLSNKQQDLCNKLASGENLSDISRATGTSLKTLFSRRKKIREAFEQQGFREYLA